MNCLELTILVDDSLPPSIVHSHRDNVGEDNKATCGGDHTCCYVLQHAPYFVNTPYQSLQLANTDAITSYSAPTPCVWLILSVLT